MVSVCLASDALLQHLPSYLGFSYLGHGVSLHGCSSKQYCAISWRNLERVTCFWHHMNSIRDWAQLRLQCKFLRFWLGGGAEIYWSSCGHLRQAWNEVPLLPKPATTNQEWLPHSPVPPCPLCPETSFRLHSENLRGYESTFPLPHTQVKNMTILKNKGGGKKR